MMKSILGIGAVIALAGQALAVTPFVEDFSYSDGSLTDVSGGLWGAHSGAGAMPVQVSGGQITLNQGSGSREDVNRSIGAPLGAGDVIFFGFDVTMSGSGSVTDTYFAHLLQGTSNFNSRIWVTGGTSGGDYTFGYGGTGSIEAVWGSDFSFGDTHRVIASYDVDANTISLWIDASSESDPSITIASTFANPYAGIAFRQAAGNTSQVIDDLRVGTTFSSVVPTPGAAALMGFAGLAAVRRRRSA